MIPFHQFRNRFPLAEVLSETEYSTVYQSRDKYVVKKQEWLSVAFFREVAVLGQFHHPNLIEAIAITIDQEYGYIAFPKGSKLREAIRERTISLRDALTDIVSGMAFLDANCLFHGDLKDDNVVVIDGKAKIIDFGFTRRSCLYEGIGRCVRGLAYTDSYRDPEYDANLISSVKSELYSITMTMYYIHNFHVPIRRRRLYLSKSDLCHCTEDMIDFLLQCQRFQSERPALAELLTHPALNAERLVTPHVVELPTASALDCGDYEKLMERVPGRLQDVDVSVSAYLLGLNLFLRSTPKAIPDFLQMSLIVSTALVQESTFERINIDLKNVFVEMYNNVGGKLYGRIPFIRYRNQLHCTLAMTLKQDYEGILYHDDTSKEDIDASTEIVYERSFEMKGKVRRQHDFTEIPVPLPSPIPPEFFLDHIARYTEEMLEREEIMFSAISTVVRYREHLHPEKMPLIMKLLRDNSRIGNGVLLDRLGL
jgi:serine/threonine protein kinase